jgi:UDP-N-acetylmuramate--alanine ligase
VRNALGAWIVARELGADVESAAAALAAFRGVDRRFQQMGEARGVTFIDDYAHHPTEIEATLSAARVAFPERRLVAVFQPHLFTRTRDFAAEFGARLAAADVVVVMDVYPARERPLAGVTGELVADAARRAGSAPVSYAATADALVDLLDRTLRSGDVCVAMGAGDIDATALRVVERLRGDA